MSRKSWAVAVMAGLAMVSLAGCFQNPTDPVTGGILGGGGTNGVPTNTSDHTTTAISALASQANTQGVYLSVVNQNGSALSANVLAAGNFRVTYNNSVIPSGSLRLSTASGAGQSISSSLVLDYSGSMSGDITNLESAATTFVNNMQSADRGDIIKFDTSIVVMQAFTADKNALRTAIADDTTYTFGGSTALYDAIWQGVQDASSETGQRAVVAFTDGGENSSTIVTSESDLISRAKSRGVPVYTIGLGSADAITLQDIAQQTNGRFYLAPDSAQLAAIYQQIAQIFSNTVIISWPSFTYQSGATLSITVTYICANGTFTSTSSLVLP
jgi:VWFA-related protein